MRVIRLLLARLVCTVRPRQAESAGLPLAGLCLYEFTTCPYCARVRWTLCRLGRSVERIDIDQDPLARDTLRAVGGKTQVPCLRIDTGSGYRWLYESRDIIAYLKREASR